MSGRESSASELGRPRPTRPVSLWQGRSSRRYVLQTFICHSADKNRRVQSTKISRIESLSRC